MRSAVVAACSFSTAAAEMRRDSCRSASTHLGVRLARRSAAARASPLLASAASLSANRASRVARSPSTMSECWRRARSSRAAESASRPAHAASQLRMARAKHMRATPRAARSTAATRSASMAVAERAALASWRRALRHTRNISAARLALQANQTLSVQLAAILWTLSRSRRAVDGFELTSVGATPNGVFAAPADRPSVLARASPSRRDDSSPPLASARQSSSARRSRSARPAPITLRSARVRSARRCFSVARRNSARADAARASAFSTSEARADTARLARASSARSRSTSAASARRASSAVRSRACAAPRDRAAAELAAASARASASPSAPAITALDSADMAIAALIASTAAAPAQPACQRASAAVNLAWRTRSPWQVTSANAQAPARAACAAAARALAMPFREASRTADARKVTATSRHLLRASRTSELSSADAESRAPCKTAARRSSILSCSLAAADACSLAARAACMARSASISPPTTSREARAVADTSHRPRARRSAPSRAARRSAWSTINVASAAACRRRDRAFGAEIGAFPSLRLALDRLSTAGAHATRADIAHAAPGSLAASRRLAVPPVANSPSHAEGLPLKERLRPKRAWQVPRRGGAGAPSAPPASPAETRASCWDARVAASCAAMRRAFSASARTSASTTLRRERSAMASASLAARSASSSLSVAIRALEAASAAWRASMRRRDRRAPISAAVACAWCIDSAERAHCPTAPQRRRRTVSDAACATTNAPSRRLVRASSASAEAAALRAVDASRASSAIRRPMCASSSCSDGLRAHSVPSATVHSLAASAASASRARCSAAAMRSALDMRSSASRASARRS
eukprot:scaffold45802_cov25-Tisochrysis_lutea.AAC.1